MIKMNHMQSNSKSNTTAFFPKISQLITTAVVVATARTIALVAVVGLTGLSVTGEAQLTPQWISRVPVGSALSAGIAGIHVDPDGVSYITGLGSFAQHRHYDCFVCARRIDPVDADVEQPR
jgi:hypothetical protein